MKYQVKIYSLEAENLNDIVCSLLKSKANTWHTVVVINNGSKYEGIISPTTYKLGDRILKKGMEGEDVKELQTRLIALGYSMPKYGADGDYGSETVSAVKAFQEDNGLEVDGEFGSKSLAALEAAKKTVKIVNGNCNIRTQGNTSGDILGVARKGETYVYAGETNNIGWNRIIYKDTNGWVSGKYSEVK